MWKIRINNKIAVLSVCVVLLVSTIFIYSSHALYTKSSKKHDEAFQLQVDAYKPRKNHFKTLALEAKAVYVYDVNSGKVLYQKNAETPLPLASVTKTMTAIVAEESSTENSVVTIDRAALDTDGDSGLKEGERWSLKNLLSFTLINSSNDGAAAVAEAIPSFVDKMNAKASELGLTTLSFNNPTGLDVEGVNDAGGYGSAKDVAKLFQYAVEKHPELFEETKYVSKSFSSETESHEAKNTNDIIGSIPNLVASKTGYTLMAGGNLGIVFDRGLNEPVVIVVLGSSYDGRFTDMLSLASSTLQTYNEAK